jgi:N-acetylmuramoyl-L-alanine amidase
VNTNTPFLGFASKRGRRLQFRQLPLACAPSAIELLEPRRLLCTIGHEDLAEVNAAPVHIYDAAGQHLNLTIIPDPSSVDVVAPTANPTGSVKKKPSGKASRDRSALSEAADSALAAGTPAPSGSLNGKIVYMNAGHGWTWNGTSVWQTQRPEYQEMVEDLTTQDQITYYAQYLINAGATVVPTRPLGHQTTELIVDNNDAGFSIQSGTWATNSASSTYWSNVNGTDTANRYRFAVPSATETAVARFTPNIPNGGFYPVYAWYANGSNRSTDVTYRINSAGGSQEVKVNQRYTGKGWVFLGVHYFQAGTGGNVEVSNKTSNGSAVIADAVRFGNGMGDWHGDNNPANPVSGKAREEELSLYWLYRSRGYTGLGAIVAESTVDGGNASDSSGGIVGPPRWVSYMNDEAQGTNVERLHISFHSNGTTGAPDASARGTLALTHNTAPTLNQAWWANAVAEEVEEDMQALPAGMIEHTWASRNNTLTGAYGEISKSNFDAFNTSGADVTASTLLEVLFHDNLQDSQLMRDPKVRDWVGRSTYQATVKYFAQWAGGSSVLLPDPPTATRATTDATGNVTLNWTAPGSGNANGGAGAATGYKVYYGTSGYTWGDVVTLGNVTSYTFAPGTLPDGQMSYFKVVAINGGGESFQRDVVAAKTQSNRRAPILIVNGFDRFDRTTNDTQTWSGNNGVTERVRLRYQNTRDYAVKFAEAIETFNPALGIETVQNEDVISGAVNLANYHTVLWMSGEESTVNDTFTATEQTLIANFLAGGGKFLASGSDIGADLDLNGGGASFYNNQLRADFVSDDAGTYTTNGVAGSVFAGVSSIVFDNGANDAMREGTYDVDAPDVITPLDGATAALTYSTGTTAAIQHSSGRAKVVTMGFPFETITDVNKRNAVMAGVLDYFGTAGTLVGPSTEPTGVDLLAGSDTGLSDTDNFTRLDNTAGKTLQFDITGTIAGAVVKLLFGTTEIGSATATGATTTITTTGLLDLPDGGPHAITAYQTEPGKLESIDSPALNLTIDTVVPTVGITAVSPDPRYTSVSSMTITFSHAITGFNLADLSLTRDGGANLLTGAQTLTTSDDVTFTLNNLTAVTDTTGEYQLTLTAAGSGVESLAGNALLDNASDTWVHALPVWLAAGGIASWNDGAKTLTVTGAATIIADPAGFPESDHPIINVIGGSLTINPDANLQIHVGELHLTDGATVTATSAVGTTRVLVIESGLSIGATSRLDLTRNAMILNGAALADVQALITSGFNDGNWNGLGGIGSSSAETNPDGLTALGYVDNAEFQASEFEGVSGLTGNEILIKHTYYGDADLSGDVTLDDFNLFLTGYQDPTGVQQLWTYGDFDYSGSVDLDDFNLFLAAYQAGGVQL